MSIVDCNRLQLSCGHLHSYFVYVGIHRFIVSLLVSNTEIFQPVADANSIDNTAVIVSLNSFCDSGGGGCVTS